MMYFSAPVVRYNISGYWGQMQEIEEPAWRYFYWGAFNM